MKNFYKYFRAIFFFVFVMFSCELDNSSLYTDDELTSGFWSSYEMPSDWKFRDGAGLIEFKGRLLMFGGWTYGEPYNGGKLVNEVWESFDGIKWKQLPNAPWSPRHGMGFTIHEEKLFILGGDFINDIWSTVDGLVWVCENKDLPFSGRYTPNLVSIKGNLVVFGGYNCFSGLCAASESCICLGDDDIWISKDGKDWKKSLSPPWNSRGLIHNSLVFKNEIYLMGGGIKQSLLNIPISETKIEFSDIWKSKDGVNWEKVTDNWEIQNRTHFSVLSAFGVIWVSDGSLGIQSNVSNDLYFSRDAKKFTQINVPLDMPKRHASSFAVFKNNLIILGGPPTDFPRGKVYVYSLNLD
jgi:hypothetical protein